MQEEQLVQSISEGLEDLRDLDLQEPNTRFEQDVMSPCWKQPDSQNFTDGSFDFSPAEVSLRGGGAGGGAT